ncbi:MAG: hypothetical protein KGJ94_10485 [Xanthomonadaceae bacterium]|nr:hypothetical protein [Xanthomonadaceae bacterium]
MRDALAHAGNCGKRVVAAFTATAFAQDTQVSEELLASTHARACAMTR